MRVSYTGANRRTEGSLKKLLKRGLTSFRGLRISRASPRHIGSRRRTGNPPGKRSAALVHCETEGMRRRRSGLVLLGVLVSDEGTGVRADLLHPTVRPWHCRGLAGDCWVLVMPWNITPIECVTGLALVGAVLVGFRPDWDCDQPESLILAQNERWRHA